MPLRKAVTIIENAGEPVVVPPPAVPSTESVTQAIWTKTATEWEIQDRKRQRSYMFQAALQSPAMLQYAPTLEAYIELVVRTANAGLAYVNE